MLPHSHKQQEGTEVLGRAVKPTIADDEVTKSSLACVLASNEVELLTNHLSSLPQVELSALCLLDDDGAQAEILSDRACVSVHTCLDNFVTACDAQLIVVSNERRLLKGKTAFAIVELALNGAAVCSLAQFLAAPEPPFRAIPERQVVDHLLEALDADRPGRRLKRAFDIVLSGLGLVLLAPLLCLIALAIKLDSPGRVLFVQVRLGRRRVPFKCLKFRTMCEDAERDTGPRWAIANDPRITRVGRVLRRSRMDELPQLINVLRGEMSIVGPRPIRHYFAEQLAELIPFYDLRFLENPGLTGWAQVKYQYSSSYTEQVEKFYYDYYYIRNRSTALDLYIMLLTATVIVRLEGA